MADYNQNYLNYVLSGAPDRSQLLNPGMNQGYSSNMAPYLDASNMGNPGAVPLNQNVNNAGSPFNLYQNQPYQNYLGTYIRPSIGQPQNPNQGMSPTSVTHSPILQQGHSSGKNSEAVQQAIQAQAMQR